MNAIVVNLSRSRLHQSFESVSLRSAFLLCERITTAGDSFYFIFYDHYESRVTTEFKLKQIEKYLANMEEDEEDGEKIKWDTEAIKATLKNLDKIKFPKPAEIIAKKSMEKRINRMYATASEEKRNTFMLFGLPQLEPIFENREQTEVLCVNNENTETDADEYIPLSSIMRRSVKTSDNSDLFCLPSEFFSPEFLPGLPIGTSADSRQARKGKGFLQHCFSFPNLNRLNVLEMETIRKEIKEPAAAFHEKCNQWLRMVYEGKDAADTSRFFDKEVLPATGAMLHVLSQNTVLENVSLQQDNKLLIDVFLGELPAETIWDFYKQYGTLPDESWKVLEHAKKELKDRRYPIMAIRTQNLLLTETDTKAKEKTEEAKIAPVKKSISID